MKIIIWGYPLHSHTHSYIHYGWNKVFKHLKFDTYWFDDTNYPEDFDYTKCLIISEGYADKNIPLDKSNIYIVHVCVDPLKYINCGARLIDMRYLSTGHQDFNYNYTVDKSKLIKISDTMYYEKLTDTSGVTKYKDNPVKVNYEAIYTCWATDLLPEEFEYDKIDCLKEKNIYYMASLGNKKEYQGFIKACKENNVNFIVNDPWRNPLSMEKVKELMQKSYMSPDIRTTGDEEKNRKGDNGTNHKLIGYIPCRVFKTISYGLLGITNSKHVKELFGDLIVYNDDEYQLFYDAEKYKNDKEYIKKQMDYVRDNHTYINRVKDLLKVLSL